MTVVVVAPGQGSQTPGFLDPWLTEPRFAAHLDALADAAGVDLRTHGTTSDADTIRDTAVAQPLIVAASLLTLAAVLGEDADDAAARRARLAGIAGHSVGELAAAAGAGILTESDAMVLVRERGRAMASAAAQVATGMSAVIGADENELLAKLAELGLEPAELQRRRPARRRRRAAGPRGAARVPARRSARHPAPGRRRVPHPLHGYPPSRPCAQSPPAFRSPTRPSRSGPTATARLSPPAPATSSCSSGRSPPPYAGIARWRPSRPPE